MDWTKLWAKIVGKEELAPEEQAAIQKLLNEQKVTAPTTATATGNESEVFKGMIASLNEQISGLTEIITTEKKDKEERLKAIEAQTKAELEAKKAAALDKLVKSAVLAPADADGKAAWEKLLNADFETTSKMIESRIAEQTKGATQAKTESIGVPAAGDKPADRSQLMETAKQSFKSNQ